MNDEFVKSNESLEVEKSSINEQNLNNEQKTNSTENSETPKENSDDAINTRLMQLEDQYKRLLADYQNLQKRTAQEKEDIYKYASERTLDALLPALDTMDYAKAVLTSETTVEKMKKDFNLVLDMFIKCLKDTGIETIDETGIPFDPVLHEPLNQVQTNELPPYTVMQILKKGYKLSGKIIRPAMVSVSVEENS